MDSQSAAPAHTAGPWRVESEAKDGWKGISIFSANDMRVANLVMSLTDNEYANARLIAAAPDLLEACQVMLEWYEKQPDDVLAPGGEAQYLRDAIAKALPTAA